MTRQPLTSAKRQGWTESTAPAEPAAADTASTVGASASTVGAAASTVADTAPMPLVHKPWRSQDWPRFTRSGTVDDALTRTSELVRPGPLVLEADSWETEPSGELANNSYQGRRRAHSRLARLWLMVALVLIGLGVVVAIPLAMRSSARPDAAVAAPPATENVQAQPGVTDDGELTSGTSAPGSRSSPTRPTASPKPANPVVSAPDATTAPPSPTVTVTVFQPLTLEAEAGANTVQGSAVRTTYPSTSAGQLVGYIGKSFDDQAAGTLRFNEVRVAAAGSYPLTFYYVSNGNRTAYISVNGGPAVTVNASRRDNCCGAGQLQVTLHAGANTITFSNPTARCPAIDRIVISGS